MMTMVASALSSGEKGEGRNAFRPCTRWLRSPRRARSPALFSSGRNQQCHPSHGCGRPPRPFPNTHDAAHRGETRKDGPGVVLSESLRLPTCALPARRAAPDGPQCLTPYSAQAQSRYCRCDVRALATPTGFRGRSWGPGSRRRVSTRWAPSVWLLRRGAAGKEYSFAPCASACIVCYHM
eukprot:scaffold3165_cov380-Prasinococcus_capsulatus_cf.AAC.13